MPARAGPRREPVGSPAGASFRMQQEPVRQGKGGSRQQSRLWLCFYSGITASAAAAFPSPSDRAFSNQVIAAAWSPASACIKPAL